MSGDYSRVRFDPSLDIAHVLMQQGRVQLDSDWNEEAAALDRRFRAESVDTFGVQPKPGITGVAVVSPQTPDAFEIETAGGKITIGRGRMYVDGLLAENHGGGTPEFDPVLAELRGKTGLGYDVQPYFPAAPALPSGGSHLAYLEVWQRELTHLERPELVEIAVGVDTTTRWQTVWQVRLLANIGSADCRTPEDQFPAWQELIQPSAGRLSVKAEGVPPEKDPCELPPTGGYRGLENQLYRIQIHDGGGADKATFKWSRDNGSVASSAVEVVSHTATATELKLASLGRDAVLRFNTGDWVEILDDRRELSGENGDPALRRGVMRKITVDDDKQTIQFSPALPADLIPAGGEDTLAARNTRVTRWDQQDGVNSNGVIAVSPLGAWITLEKGVKVCFTLDPAAGEFHCGDYWVSAARTDGNSVDTSIEAPPRGIHRHYTRLAIVTFPDKAASCRVLWPPACGGCCTVTVAPGESIQAALDSLPSEGGCVCLKTGVHPISQAIRIRGPNIILHGESPGTIVRHSAGPLMVRIGSDDKSTIDNVRVEEIRFEASDDGGDNELIGAAMIEVHRLADGALRRCALAPASAVRHFAALGVLVTDSGRVTLAENRVENLLGGVLVLRSGGVEVTRNLLLGPTADLAAAKPGASTGSGSSSVGLVGIEYDDEAIGPACIAGNRIDNYLLGILVGVGVEGAVVRENHITRNGAVIPQAPTSTTGTLSATDRIDLKPFSGEFAQFLSLAWCFFAIDVAGPRSIVIGNGINLTDARQGGIRLRGPHQRAAHNFVRSDFAHLEGQTHLRLPPVGIVVHDPLGEQPVIDCCVQANLLTGLQNAITVGDGTLLPERIVVRDNRVEGSTELVAQVADRFVNPERAPTFDIDSDFQAIFGNYAVAASQADGLVAGNLIRAVATGVYLWHGQGNCVSDNRISDGIAGIVAELETAPQLCDNVIRGAPFSGIHASDCTHGRVEGNTVTGTAWFGLGIGAGGDNQVVTNIVSDGGVGIWAGGETRPVIVGNSVERMKSGGIIAYQCVGNVLCAHDRVAWCSYAGIPQLMLGTGGAAEENQLGVGLMVLNSTGDVAVESCEVRGTGRADDADGAMLFSESTFGIYVLTQGRCRVLANRVLAAEGLVLDVTHGGILVGAFYDLGGKSAALGDRPVGVQLLDNSITGITGSLVFGRAQEDLAFANNRCEHHPVVTPGIPPRMTVWLIAPRLQVSGNHVRATDSAVPSIRTNCTYLSAVGNVMSGPWQPIPAAPNVKPAPVEDFNLLNVP